MKTVTVAEIMALRPCEAYTTDRVTKLWAGRTSLSAVDILRLDIDWSDRLWAVRMGKMLPDCVWQLWAIDCATRVLPLFEKSRPGDSRVRDCLRATVDYLDGKITLEALRQARAAADAAYAAADAAAAAADADAAYAAADAAAAAADADAAYAAAAAADAAAADAYARSAERAWQQARLIELTEKYGDTK